MFFVIFSLMTLYDYYKPSIDAYDKIMLECFLPVLPERFISPLLPDVQKCSYLFVD